MLKGLTPLKRAAVTDKCWFSPATGGLTRRGLKRDLGRCSATLLSGSESKQGLTASELIFAAVVERLWLPFMKPLRGDEPGASVAAPEAAGLPPGVILSAHYLEDVAPFEGHSCLLARDSGILIGVVVEKSLNKQLRTTARKTEQTFLSSLISCFWTVRTWLPGSASCAVAKPVCSLFERCHICKEHTFVWSVAELNMWAASMKTQWRQILPANDRQLVLTLTQRRLTCSARCYGTFLLSGGSSSLGKAGMIMNLTSVWECACNTNSEKSRGVLLGSGKSNARPWFCLFHKHETLTLQSRQCCCTVTAGTQERIAQLRLLFSGQVLFELEPEKNAMIDLIDKLLWKLESPHILEEAQVETSKKDWLLFFVTFSFFVIWFKLLAFFKSSIKNQELKLAEQLGR